MKLRIWIQQYLKSTTRIRRRIWRGFRRRKPGRKSRRTTRRSRRTRRRWQSRRARSKCSRISKRLNWNEYRGRIRTQGRQLRKTRRVWRDRNRGPKRMVGKVQPDSRSKHVDRIQTIPNYRRYLVGAAARWYDEVKG